MGEGQLTSPRHILTTPLTHAKHDIVSSTNTLTVPASPVPSTTNTHHVTVMSPVQTLTPPDSLVLGKSLSALTLDFPVPLAVSVALIPSLTVVACQDTPQVSHGAVELSSLGPSAVGVEASVDVSIGPSVVGVEVSLDTFPSIHVPVYTGPSAMGVEESMDTIPGPSAVRIEELMDATTGRR